MIVHCSSRELIEIAAALIIAGGVGGWLAAGRTPGPVGAPSVDVLPGPGSAPTRKSPNGPGHGTPPMIPGPVTQGPDVPSFASQPSTLSGVPASEPKPPIVPPPPPGMVIP